MDGVVAIPGLTIMYKPGPQNAVEDGLSRAPQHLSLEQGRFCAVFRYADPQGVGLRWAKVPKQFTGVRKATLPRLTEIQEKGGEAPGKDNADAQFEQIFKTRTSPDYIKI